MAAGRPSHFHPPFPAHYSAALPPPKGPRSARTIFFVRRASPDAAATGRVIPNRREILTVGHDADSPLKPLNAAPAITAQSRIRSCSNRRRHPCNRSRSESPPTYTDVRINGKGGGVLVGLADWRGLIYGRADDYHDLNLIAVTAPGGQSWASPFRGIADDGQDYFVKTLEGCKRDWARGSLAVEYIVGQVGTLIGAPVCESALIRIPDEFADYEIAPGVVLVPGVAHASKAIAHAEEQRDDLAYRSDDHNRARHAGGIRSL
ncbi:HipA family kinase [Spongiactinospora sp. 9N601]|uniref:HipA family kinase n=1 Tax=Spongiactinospora sp. 9N601 TaxID=3375149 RepID=UPI0037A6E9B9